MHARDCFDRAEDLHFFLLGATVYRRFGAVRPFARNSLNPLRFTSCARRLFGRLVPESDISPPVPPHFDFSVSPSRFQFIIRFHCGNPTIDRTGTAAATCSCRLVKVIERGKSELPRNRRPVPPSSELFRFRIRIEATIVHDVGRRSHLQRQTISRAIRPFLFFYFRQSFDSHTLSRLAPSSGCDGRLVLIRIDLDNEEFLFFYEFNSIECANELLRAIGPIHSGSFARFSTENVLKPSADTSAQK